MASRQVIGRGRVLYDCLSQKQVTWRQHVAVQKSGARKVYFSRPFLISGLTDCTAIERREIVVYSLYCFTIFWILMPSCGV